MYVQRTQSLNIQIDDEQAAGGTNWNNVQSRLRDLFRPNPRVGQQKQNILQTLVGQFAVLPSDEDSFANRSQIQASTPVISTPKNGSVRACSHMKLPRISAIPRTPLRSVSSLANVSTRPENASIKRKSTSSTPKASAKKIKTNKSIETVHKTPKSALHFIEQFNNMESPYNSPLTPNTIKNLNHQQSLYRTYQQSRMTVNQSMFPNRTTSVAPMEDTSVQTSFSPKTNVNRPYEEVQESTRKNVTSSTVVQEQPAVQLENTVNVSKNRVKHATTLVDYDETMPSFNNGLADDNSAHDVSSHPDDLLSEDEQEKKDEEEKGGSSDEEEEEGEDRQSVSAEEEEEEEEDNQSVSSDEEEEAEVTGNKAAAAAAARRTLVNSGYLTDDSEEEEEQQQQQQQEEVEDTGNKAAAAARRTLVNSGYLTDDSGEESSSSSSDDDDDEDEAEEEEEEESVIKPNASRATKAGLVNSGYLSEHTASSPLPLTTNIVRVQDSSDSFSREEKFVHEEVTPRPEDFFGIYAEADDDDDELQQQESRMPPSSFKSSLSRPSSLSGSSSRLNLKAKSARKSAVMSDSSDEEEEDDDHHHHHHHHNSGHQSPIYSSPVEDPVEEEEEEHEEEEEEEEDHHDYHRPMSPASASSHSDSHSDEEEEQEEESELEEEEEEEEAKPLPRAGSSSRRPKHSKDSLKRRIAKHLDEHSAVIRPSDTTFDCRRSKRNRVRPVNYWAGERPLYQKSITKDGNCVSTLVGVSSVRRIEPTRIGRKRTASAAAKGRKSKGKEAEVSAAQKMENILNLSIHKKKLANATAESSRADPEHVRAFAELDFTESKNSQGVFTVMTKREDKIALGKLKFNPRAKKVPTKTGNYVTHFNVVYGTLLLKVNNDKVGSIIKSGFYVNVDSQTTYSIENLRNDQAVLDFTIIQKP